MNALLNTKCGRKEPLAPLAARRDFQNQAGMPDFSGASEKNNPRWSSFRDLATHGRLVAEWEAR